MSKNHKITTLDIYFSSNSSEESSSLSNSNVSGSSDSNNNNNNSFDSNFNSNLNSNLKHNNKLTKEELIFTDFLDSQKGKYIKFENNKYIVSRVIGGEEKVFGQFTKLEYAEEYEYKLIVNAFDDSFKNPLLSPYGRFITKHGNKFYINRKINGERKSFGSFNELRNALNKREELIDDNWGVDGEISTYIKSRYGKYIGFLEDIFVITKSFDGEVYNFGKFDTLENATIARDILVENNWDDSKVPENLYSWRFFTQYHPLTNSWEIFNMVDNDLVSFGLFKTVPIVKKALNILIENNWDSSYVPLDYYHDYSNIRRFKRPSGDYFSVVRKINDEIINIESFDNYDGAREFRNKLLLNNWVIEDEEELFEEYIYYKGDKFLVKNNGIVYGEFDRICDATDFRLECIKKNWEI